MKKIILSFATRNTNKIKEIKSYLGSDYHIKGLSELGIEYDIPETGLTFKENAYIKASYLNNKFGTLSLAEDSGLVVPSLEGAPGIYSSRYAKDTPLTNNEFLLSNLCNKLDRKAYYISVIALISGVETHYFEGRCYGKIALSEEGLNGFGYDPIFIPDGYDLSFGILSHDIKLKISHRSKAIDQLISFMQKNKIKSSSS